MSTKESQEIMNNIPSPRYSPRLLELNAMAGNWEHDPVYKRTIKLFNIWKNAI